MSIRTLVAICGLIALPACVADDDEPDARRAAAPQPAVQQQPAAPNAVVVRWEDGRPLTPEELERGRLDADWRQAVQFDTLAPGATARNPERWEAITAQSVNTGKPFTPLFGDVAGPSVLRAQVLLDRALFSPGVMDGRWGKNTEKAVYWLQKREGLKATGQVDAPTLARLTELAGNPQQIVRAHTLTPEDVEGPFVEIPEDIYEHAKLECSCYESLGEKLAEKFHVTRELLSKLNPGAQLDSLRAGQTIQVPDVRPADATGVGTRIARLIVSDRGKYLHAVDSTGRIIYHFPTTVGASYDPSPTGNYKVNSVTPDPVWHYQPAILAKVKDKSAPDAKIPPGPNNAVGTVWIDLSAEHYGIHGTRAPESIGYTQSAGCVRLTNWDVEFLGKQVRKGTPVEFRDTQPGAKDPAQATQRRA